MALVRKILEATIPSGGSSATFTDSDIPNSLIRVCSTNSNIYPQNISLAGTTLTVTYEQVTSALGVSVELVKQGLEIDNSLDSDASDHALSALQGKNLKTMIDNIPEGKSNISDMNDVDITDIEEGQVLAWDETSEKFINVDQSGGSSNIYSNNEVVVGSYNGKPLYRKMISTPINTNNLISGVIYNTGIYISNFIANVETLFPISDHSWINLGNAIRGFLYITSEDNSALDCGTIYSRNGTAYITVEYTKTTD